MNAKKRDGQIDPSAARWHIVDPALWIVLVPRTADRDRSCRFPRREPTNPVDLVFDLAATGFMSDRAFEVIAAVGAATIIEAQHMEAAPG